jgi:uncharacterized protein
MSYAKFKLGDSHIYYEIDSNTLYNGSGEQLSMPPEQDPEFYESVQHLHGTTKKINKPVALRILFGHACNYDCSYCMQKDIGNPNERVKNMFLQRFMEQIRDNLDLENLERVELWGGEPFLYWNDIKPVMELLDKEGLHFFISTNGSPLRQKHVDFFKTLKASVQLSISHDGPGQNLLRGKDILETAAVCDVLKQFDDVYPKIQFSFNCVVSKLNYDLFKINAYFKRAADRIGITRPRISFILGRNYDETDSQNSAHFLIGDEDRPKFKKILHDYIDAEVAQLKEHGLDKQQALIQSNLVVGNEGAYGFAKIMRRQVPITMTSSCGADAADILSLDIKGNIRLCPHTDEKYNVGKIDAIPLAQVKHLDLDRKKSHCGDCNVRRLCKSSCPIKFPDSVFMQNCKNEKVWYGAIQTKAFGLIFGQEPELVELGIEEINEA